MAARYKLAEAFEKISLARCSVSRFSRREVPASVLRRVLELTQQAPSSFNLQPYKFIIVRSDEAKQALSSSMMGGNRYKVDQAPASVVFLSHREPFSLVQSLMKLEESLGKDAAYVRSLPAKLNFLLGPGLVSHGIRRLVSHLASPLTPSPVIPFGSQWAVKNSMFAAQQLLLSSAAYGVGSAPMEGFDERRICYQLGIPIDRYSIPLVVSLGYVDEQPTECETAEVVSLGQSKPRYPLEDVCFENKYGQALSI